MARVRDREEQEIEVIESERYEIGMVLKREQYDNKKLKKKAWHYYVEVILRGKAIEVDFVPKGSGDVGGYDLLDQIFNGRREMPLYAKDFKFENNGGEVVEGVSYECFEEVDGFELCIGIKPSKNSDKALMDFALARFKAKQAAELAASADPVTGEVLDNIPADKPEKKNKS